MSENTRNYHAHGGSEWVIGGKLTFLPGATVAGAEDIQYESRDKTGGVVGAEGLFDLPRAVQCDLSTLPYIPDSDATSVAQLRDHFNQLLSAMRAAGIMAAESKVNTGRLNK